MSDKVVRPETSEAIYGRLLEAVHISGYTMGRACTELEYLLKEGKWKEVGSGFEDIDEFARSIDMSQFKVAVDRRKKLAKMFEDEQASQRATAEALGVNEVTVARDLGKDRGKRQMSQNDDDVSANKPEEPTNVAPEVPEEKPTPAISMSGDDVAKKVSEKAHVANNSGDNEWYTPEPYIMAALEVMGTIDLDPASTEAANEIVKATEIYTIDDDSLNQDWLGNVWMNPPYAGEWIGQFCQKICEEYRNGNTTQAIVLVNNATETQWFQRLLSRASAVCFPAGRVKFWHPEKIKEAAPLQGQALLYLGDKKEEFRSIFRKFGKVAMLK